MTWPVVRSAPLVPSRQWDGCQTVPVSSGEAPWHRLPRWAQRAYITVAGALVGLLVLRVIMINWLSLPLWLGGTVMVIVCFGVGPSLVRWIMEDRWGASE